MTDRLEIFDAPVPIGMTGFASNGDVHLNPPYLYERAALSQETSTIINTAIRIWLAFFVTCFCESHAFAAVQKEITQPKRLDRSDSFFGDSSPNQTGFLAAGVGLWGFNAAAGLLIKSYFIGRVYYETDTSVLEQFAGKTFDERMFGLLGSVRIFHTPIVLSSGLSLRSIQHNGVVLRDAEYGSEVRYQKEDLCFEFAASIEKVSGRLYLGFIPFGVYTPIRNFRLAAQANQNDKKSNALPFNEDAAKRAIMKREMFGVHLLRGYIGVNF